MERITDADVRQRFTLLQSRMPEGVKLVLQQGSPTYGRAWRVYRQESGLSDYFNLGSGYIGWSKREAYYSLNALIGGFDAGREQGIAETEDHHLQVAIEQAEL